MNIDLIHHTTNNDILDSANAYLRCGANINAVCYLIGVNYAVFEALVENEGYSVGEYLDLQKKVGEAELLLAQFTMAKKNPQISIHLGKVILGQREPEIDTKGQVKIFGIATIAETQLVKA
jgi:hypothetical protein